MNRNLISLKVMFMLLSIFANKGFCQENYIGFKANLSHYVSVIEKNRIFWNIPPSQHKLTNEYIEGNKKFFSPHTALNFIYRHEFYERKKVELAVSFGLGYFFSFKKIKWSGTGMDNFSYQKSFTGTYTSRKNGIAVPALLHCTWHNISFYSGLFFHGIIDTKNYFSYSSIEQSAPFEITDNGAFASPIEIQNFFSISIPLAIGYTFNIAKQQRINVSLEYYFGAFDFDGISIGIVPARQKIRNDFVGIGFTYEYHLKSKNK